MCAGAELPARACLSLTNILEHHLLHMQQVLFMLSLCHMLQPIIKLPAVLWTSVAAARYVSVPAAGLSSLLHLVHVVQRSQLADADQLVCFAVLPAALLVLWGATLELRVVKEKVTILAPLD